MTNIRNIRNDKYMYMYTYIIYRIDLVVDGSLSLLSRNASKLAISNWPSTISISNCSDLRTWVHAKSKLIRRSLKS